MYKRVNINKHHITLNIVYFFLQKPYPYFPIVSPGLTLYIMRRLTTSVDT